MRGTTVNMLILTYLMSSDRNVTLARQPNVSTNSR